MFAGGRDLEGTPRSRLPPHVDEVGTARVCAERGCDDRSFERQRLLSRRVPADVPQMRSDEHAGAIRQCRFASIGHRHDQVMADPRGLQRTGQQSARAVQLAAQRQLAIEFDAREWPRRQSLRRHENADRDGEVEPASFLGQVGRREVDRDAARRKLVAAIGQRRAHPVLALLDRGFEQPDHREGRQAGPDVDFDPHQRRLETLRRATEKRGERHDGSAGKEWCCRYAATAWDAQAENRSLSLRMPA